MAKILKLPGEALPTTYSQIPADFTLYQNGLPLMLQVQPGAVAFKQLTSLSAI